MNILINTYPLAFQSPGGGEAVLENIMAGLNRKGHKADFFNPKLTRISDYQIIHHFGLLDFPIWSFYHSMPRKLVITPTFFKPKCYLKKMKQTSAEILKKIIYPRNFSYTSLNQALKLPDLILPTTQSEADQLTFYYGKNLLERIAVLPNGVHSVSNWTHQESPEIAEKIRQAQDNGAYALFVANLTPIKNLHLAISCALEAGLKLIVVGEFPANEKEYKNLCLMKAKQGEINFLGRLPPLSQGLSSLYRKANVTIVPSQFETCSLVGLESGIHETPVIITKNGGTTDVFKDFVDYIDPKKPSELTAKLLQYTGPKKPNLKLAKYIAENYHWDNIIEKLITLYKSTLKQI